MAIPPIGTLAADISRIWKDFQGLAQKVFSIAETQNRHTALLAAQAASIAALQDSVKILQAREDVLLARASQEAAQSAAVTVSDLARRLGVMEGRAGRTAAEPN